MTAIPPPARGLADRCRQARERHGHWVPLWQECYDFALPVRSGVVRPSSPGAKKTDRLFDGTAPDAVDHLAASLLAYLTPPWSRWFALALGPDAGPAERDHLGPALERATATLQAHFTRSNFAVEAHQGFLDLVVAGTACLAFEEAQPGEPSAFRFAAVPLMDLALEEGPSGRPDGVFRRLSLTPDRLVARFPDAELPPEVRRAAAEGAGGPLPVVEAALPDERGYAYTVLLDDAMGSAGSWPVLAEGRFGRSPFIPFRWLKAPGEVYGRSPVMKALPDIKTVNKVVELVLKNASLAVSGIWQADDDGVLNPATIKLTPGTILPKAVGSAGLTPLQFPARFDVSAMVLDDLRGRVRGALFTDKLGPAGGPKMTATEIVERTAEAARLLGATYGRLQSELLTPLVQRGLAILERRGEIPPLPVDGRTVDIRFLSPLARHQGQAQVTDVLSWLNAVAGLGPEAQAAVDRAAAARWLAKALGVPEDLVKDPPPAVDARTLAALLPTEAADDRC